jgi:hypothetical protein
MANNRVVSKKELDESGMSLRDFLNKERGLTRKAPEGTKFGVNVARPTKEARAAMNAQDNADRGMDEMGQPLQRNAGYVPRNQYRDSGHEAVDKGDEMIRRDKSMAAYTPRRDPNAAAREMLSSGSGDEAGNAMKRGGAVKKMASGGSASSRADGIAQRGKTKGTMVMCGGGMARGKK